jgi:hypothetical protein
MGKLKILSVRMTPNPVETEKKLLIAVSVIDIEEAAGKLHYSGDEYYSGQPIELML